MSFGSSASPDKSGEVGSSIEVGYMIGYVSSESMGAGEGERASDRSRSRTEGFEEAGEGYEDGYVPVCSIGWLIVRSANPRSNVEHLRRFAVTNERSSWTWSCSSLSDEDDEGDGGSLRLWDGMLNHGWRIA
jgi:hypothetical protein